MKTIKPKDMEIRVRNKYTKEEGWADVDEILDTIQELAIETKNEKTK